MDKISKSARAIELFNLGISEFNKGLHAEALDNLAQAAALESGNATYASFYGQALYHTGDLAKAREFLGRAASYDPDFFPSWKYLGLTCRALGDPTTAAEAFGHALELQKTDRVCANLFMESFGQIYLEKYSPWLKSIILLCLGIEGADHQLIGRAWADYYMMDPGTSAIRETETDSRIPPGLNDAYLTNGLQLMYACSMPFERVMTKLRHLFLDKWKDDLNAYQTFLYSLATQTWLNEYVYALSTAEKNLVNALRSALETKIEDTSSYVTKLYLYGCYEPLYTLNNAKEILKAFENSKFPLLKKLLELQVTEPLQEQEIKKTIRTARISDDVSQAVRAQYESNPYPRWRHVNRNVKTNPQAIDILIAGCGTGMQTALCAALHPNAKIHSIDLSLSSLAYAKRQTDALDFRNLSFEQADILDFDPGAQKYDLIECIGVLHHMKDPAAGLKALVRHLKPGGKIWLGLYSAIARHDIAILRRMIAGGEIKSQDLRNLRQEIADHPDRMINWFIYKSDFYTTSSCCDLIWHAQEYHFTLPEIEKLLADNDLVFGEFFFTSDHVFHAFRTAHSCADNDLQAWHAFEQKNPALFAGMYVFTVTRA